AACRSEIPASQPLWCSSIALGIGANPDLQRRSCCAVLLRSLPYSDPDRLVMVWFTSPKRPDQNNVATFGNDLALQERNRVFEHIGGFQYGLSENLRVGSDDTGVAEQVSGQRLSAALPRTLGVRPLLTEAEAQRGADATVVVSYRLWQRVSPEPRTLSEGRSASTAPSPPSSARSTTSGRKATTSPDRSPSR